MANRKKQSKRHIEYLPVDDIVPDPQNPKTHVLDDIEDSMRRFGYTEPILMDERTGKLISGHGRTEVLVAAQGKGLDPPDGVIVTADGTWTIPVVRGWSSKDDIEAKAYLIAANRLTERGGWLADPLAELLAEIGESGHGLSGVGYDDDEAADLIAQVAGTPDADAMERDEPEEADFWPVLRFKVPPSLRGKYLALIADVPGGDVEQFRWMIESAEKYRDSLAKKRRR